MASTARVSAGDGSRFEVWRSATLEGVLFARGSRLSHAFPKHWHDEIHFCAYDAGYGHFACRGKSLVVGAGDLVVTPPGEVHENWVNSVEGIGFRGAYVEVTALYGWMADVTEAEIRLPEFGELIVQSESVRRGFWRWCVAEEGLEAGQAVLEFVASLVSECATQSKRLSRVGEEPFAVRRVRDYIDENYWQTISLAELSQVAGLSSFHLHRVFCRRVGMPPHAYQTQVRINRAKVLLREMRSLAEVAQLAGFADQSHFTRHFRRLVGITPGRFLS